MRRIEAVGSTSFPGNPEVGFRLFNHLESVRVADFGMDKYEVTNRQFKEFVDKGGYANRDYWREPFILKLEEKVSESEFCPRAVEYAKRTEDWRTFERNGRKGRDDPFLREDWRPGRADRTLKWQAPSNP